VTVLTGDTTMAYLWRRHLASRRGNRRRRRLIQAGPREGENLQGRSGEPEDRRLRSRYRDGKWLKNGTDTGHTPAELARICLLQRWNELPEDSARAGGHAPLPRQGLRFVFSNGALRAVPSKWDIETGLRQALKIVAWTMAPRHQPEMGRAGRGGIVQAIGGSLYEHCMYGHRGPAPERQQGRYLVPRRRRCPPDHRMRARADADEDFQARRDRRGRTRHRRRAGAGDNERGVNDACARGAKVAASTSPPTRCVGDALEKYLSSSR